MRHPRRLFAYRLASILGWLDVDALMQAAPKRLMDEWQGYLLLEPRGPLEDERRAVLTGLLASGRNASHWLHRTPRGVSVGRPQSHRDMDAAIDAL